MWKPNRVNRQLVLYCKIVFTRVICKQPLAGDNNPQVSQPPLKDAPTP